MAPKQSATDWLAVDPVVSNELRPWYDHNGVKSLWHVKIHQSGYQTWFLGCAFIWFGIYTMHWLQVACIVVSLHIWSFATEDRGCPTTSWRRRSLPSSFQYEQMDQDERFVCWSCPTWGHLGSFVRYCQKCKACLSRQTWAYYNLCQRKQCNVVTNSFVTPTKLSVDMQPCTLKIHTIGFWSFLVLYFSPKGLSVLCHASP